MNRRHVLHLLSGAALAGGFPGSTSLRGANQTKRPEESVIIVGGGVSGLAAAEQLREAGHRNMVIIEARDRLGGRVWTSNAWKDTPVDLGASWIHGTRRNPITRLAEQAGVEMAVTDYEDVELYGTDGALLSREEEKQLERLAFKLDRVLARAEDIRASSLGEFLSDSFSGLSAEDSRLLRFLVHSMIETDYAEDVEDLDIRALEFGKEFRGQDVLFPGGYFKVFAPRYAPFEVRLNHTVHKIQWGKKGVTLQTNQGELSADRLILTVPLGVLQKGNLHLEPGLPKQKMDALETLGMGCLNKAFFRFPESFWSKEVQGFGIVGNKPGQFSDWMNLQAHHSEPVLLVFNSGSFAREIETWSNEEVQGEAMRKLRKIYGTSIPDPSGTQITRWASDPFSLGSYSSLRPGSNRSTVKDLRRPLKGRFFFAGEATSLDYPSTVHGAYLSGKRAADELLAAF